MTIRKFLFWNAVLFLLAGVAFQFGQHVIGAFAFVAAFIAFALGPNII